MRRYAGVLLDVDGTLLDSNDTHAHAWVEALAEHGIEVAFERVRRLYASLYQRAPTAAEMQTALAFVQPEAVPAANPATSLTPWQQLAQALMLANEFVFVD